MIAKGFFVIIVRKTGHKDWNGLACLEELHLCVHSTKYYVSRNWWVKAVGTFLIIMFAFGHDDRLVFSWPKSLHSLITKLMLFAKLHPNALLFYWHRKAHRREESHTTNLLFTSKSLHCLIIMLMCLPMSSESFFALFTLNIMDRASVSSFYDIWPSFGAALNLWRTWDIIGSYCLQLQRNLEKDVYLFDKLLKGSVFYAWFVRSSQCCYHSSRTSRVAQWQSLLFLKKTICLQRSLILRYHLWSILCKVENLQDDLLSILIVSIIELTFEGTWNLWFSRCADPDQKLQIHLFSYRFCIIQIKWSTFCCVLETAKVFSACG